MYKNVVWQKKKVVVIGNNSAGSVYRNINSFCGGLCQNCTYSKRSPVHFVFSCYRSVRFSGFGKKCIKSFCVFWKRIWGTEKDNSFVVSFYVKGFYVFKGPWSKWKMQRFIGFRIALGKQTLLRYNWIIVCLSKRIFSKPGTKSELPVNDTYYIFHFFSSYRFPSAPYR